MKEYRVLETNLNKKTARAVKRITYLLLAVLVLLMTATVVLYAVGRSFFSEPIPEEIKPFDRKTAQIGDYVEYEVTSSLPLFKSTKTIDGHGYEASLYCLCYLKDGGTCLAVTGADPNDDSKNNVLAGRYYGRVSAYDDNVQGLLDNERHFVPDLEQMAEAVNNGEDINSVLENSKGNFINDNKELYSELFGGYQLSASTTVPTHTDPRGGMFSYALFAAIAWFIFMAIYYKFLQVPVIGKVRQHLEQKQQLEMQR